MSRINRLTTLTSLSLLLTTLLWLAAKPEMWQFTDQPLRNLSQLLALIGTVLVSMTLILSTRLSKLEDWLGGLDKVLNVHHWLGAIGFMLIVNHPILLAIQALPATSVAIRYLTLTDNFAYNVGLIGLSVMVLGFCCMVFMSLPYHWWLKTHQLLGWGFIVGAVHGFLVSSDISAFLPLKIWMLGWVGMAITATLYTLVWQKILPARKWYKISKLDQRGDILIVTLALLDHKPLKFKAGQFVQVSFFSPALSQESHPFSILSSPADSDIAVGIKMHGDYTKLLSALSIGNLAAVAGPFGRFGQLNENGEVMDLSQPIETDQNNEVWVAAGIGVTPFLSMLRQEVTSPRNQHIWLYYCYRNQEDAVFKTEIEDLLPYAPHVRFVAWQTSIQNRLTFSEILRTCSSKSIYRFLMCGPTQFMESLANQAIRAGITEQKIHYESFEFAS